MYRHSERVSCRGLCQPKNFLPAGTRISLCEQWRTVEVDEELAVMSFALFDCDEKMALLFERILKGLVADGLYRLQLHATPMRRLVSDDLSWVKVNRLSTRAGPDRSLRN